MKIYCINQINLILQVTGITSGRAAALVPAGLGLLSVIAGWAALKISKTQNRNGRLGAIIALLLGVAALILSIIHLARASSSNFGTGSGKLGAIVALVLGLIGIILGMIAWARSKSGNSVPR